MPEFKTKKEALEYANSLPDETDQDEETDVTVTEHKDGSKTYGFKVKRSDPKWAWAFGSNEESEEDKDEETEEEDKEEPKSKARSKYFG